LTCSISFGWLKPIRINGNEIKLKLKLNTMKQVSKSKHNIFDSDSLPGNYENLPELVIIGHHM
jgi:hypothetical protein